MVRCPQCGSGSAKNSSAIYEQGISRSWGRSGGFWYSRGGPGVWSGRSSSERISGAAARNAPTGCELEAFSFIGVFAAALLLGFFTADSIGSFVMTVPIAFVVAGIAAFAVAIPRRNNALPRRPNMMVNGIALNAVTSLKSILTGPIRALPGTPPLQARRAGRVRWLPRGLCVAHSQSCPTRQVRNRPRWHVATDDRCPSKRKRPLV